VELGMGSQTGIQNDFERVQQEYNTIHSEKKELEKRRETVGQESQKKLKESKDYREKLCVHQSFSLKAK
jgi:uncharacterized protein (DUF3084 family)